MARSSKNGFCTRSGPTAGVGSASAGFTLIEVVVALALFALIAAAGAALVSTVLDAERHTAGRLDRLADAERAIALITRDLTEIADAPLTGTATAIAFDRHRAGAGGGAVFYRRAGTRFERLSTGRAQVLLDPVAGVHWHYYTRPSGWRDQWPGTPAEARAWPTAVAVDIDLAGAPPNGRLRRTIDLPVRPLPPGTVVTGAATTGAATAP